jgi:hypothetical protein
MPVSAYRLVDFLRLARFDALLFLGALPVALRFFAAFFGAGTLAPFSRASDKPMATACFGLVTFFPERPDLSFPSFISCIACPTDFCAVFEYFAITFRFK